ncbi:MAG: PsbP-related protein [Candidatus Staskawiczbacteria bacterium]|nr:PsbP-related protein [Candidatus Staskawiczbacteria bacterium]
MQKEKQKGISTLTGIIIIIVVAVVLFGGVFAYQYFTAKSQQNSKFFGSSQKTNQTQTQTTAGWKTYTNSQYGYEIKYPEDWRKSGIEPPTWISPVEGTVYISIVSYPKIGLGTIINGCPNIAGTDVSSEIAGKEKVGGLEFCKYTEIQSGMGGAKFQSFSYFITNDNYGYFIDLTAPYKPNQTESDFKYELNIFDQMVSTFKFTK